MSNIRQSGRVRKTVDYTFSEFDQEINDAVDRDKRNKRAGDQEIQPSIAATRGTRQSKRRRMLYNDSDSDSNYDPGSPMVEPQIPKHPERHVYLRRHENGVANDSSDEIKVEKQEDVLKGAINDGSGSSDTTLPKDNVVYDEASVEYNKLSNENFDTGVGASSSKNDDSGSMKENIDKLISQSTAELKGSVNTDIQTGDASSVENNKLSDANLDTVDNGSSQTIDAVVRPLMHAVVRPVDKLNNQVPEDVKSSVNTKIQADDTSGQIGHNSPLNSSLDQDMPSPNVPSEDTLKSSISSTQVQTSTETNKGSTANGKECTPVESNCDMLNSRDINLLTQENEQPHSIRKSPDHLHGSQTIA